MEELAHNRTRSRQTLNALVITLVAATVFTVVTSTVRARPRPREPVS